MACLSRWELQAFSTLCMITKVAQPGTCRRSELDRFTASAWTAAALACRRQQWRRKAPVCRPRFHRRDGGRRIRSDGVARRKGGMTVPPRAPSRHVRLAPVFDTVPSQAELDRIVAADARLGPGDRGLGRGRHAGCATRSRTPGRVGPAVGSMSGTPCGGDPQGAALAAVYARLEQPRTAANTTKR